MNQFDRTVNTDDVLTILNSSGGNSSVLEFDNNGLSNYRWRNGVHLHHTISSNFRIQTGISTEYRRTGNYVVSNTYDGQTDLNIIPKNSAMEVSPFIFSNYQIQNYHFTFGARYVDNSEYGNDSLFHLSAVRKLNENSSIKAIYSEGFSSPSFYQDIDIDSFGNPVNTSLVSETNHTLDLAYSFENTNHLIVINAFYSELSNLILSVAGVPQNSSGTLVRSGYEIDYQMAFSHELHYLLNFAWLKQGNNLSSEDALASIYPEYAISMGFNKTVIDNVVAGTTIKWISDTQTTDSSTAMNVFTEYRKHSHSFSAQIYNLLGQAIHKPDGNNQLTSTLAENDQPYLELGWHYQY